MPKHYYWVLLILLVIVFAVFVHGRLLGNVADPDAFYHIKHSWLYRTEGIFQNAFPWAQYSAINRYSADLWYGFHILILPLTLFSDLLRGIALGELLVAIAALLLVFCAFKRLEIKWPVFWLFVFALITADLLYRLNMLRPHPLSLGLALIIFANLAKPARHSRLWILLASAGFSWLHLSLTWLPILAASAVIVFEVLLRQRFDIKKYGAMAIGLLVGWLLRPNPFGAAKLAYIQVAQLLLEKQGDLPLRFGRELSPFFLENFIDQHIPLALFFAAALGFWLWLVKTKKITGLPTGFRVTVWSSLVLAIIFAFLTFEVARRSNELLVGFGIIFISSVFSHWFAVYRPKINRRAIGLTAAGIAVLVLLIYIPAKAIYRFDSYVPRAISPLRFQDALTWLENNSRAGEIVFNIQWDRFAQFFFWNHSNYYINGMDPIFEYAYAPALYWKTHFLHIDTATVYTCGKIRCTAEEVESTPLVLKRDFKASYILVEKFRNPNVFRYLESAPEFRKVFDNQSEAVYQIL